MPLTVECGAIVEYFGSNDYCKVYKRDRVPHATLLVWKNNGGDGDEYDPDPAFHRNDWFLELHDQKGSERIIKYSLLKCKGMEIFAKFIHEGKATVKVKHPACQIMITRTTTLSDLKRVITNLMKFKRRHFGGSELPPKFGGGGKVGSEVMKWDIEKAKREKERKKPSSRAFCQWKTPQDVVRTRTLLEGHRRGASPNGRNMGSKFAEVAGVNNQGKWVLQDDESPAGGRGKKLTPSGSERKRQISKNKLPVIPEEFREGAALREQGLNEKQALVVNSICNGLNVFFTGGAGVGKSFVANKIVELFRSANGTTAGGMKFFKKRRLTMCATTGVAAANIGGVTIHGFAGLTSEECDPALSKEEVWSRIKRRCSPYSKDGLFQRWKHVDVLLIDEISMLPADFWDKMEYIARKTRKNDRPFGGVQIIVGGDFLQLPPVPFRGKGQNSYSSTVEYCFQAKSWNRVIDVVVELTEVYRQKGDQLYADVLREIRLGRCSREHLELLMATKDNVFEEEEDHLGQENRFNSVKRGVTKLCTHNREMKNVNEEKIKSLQNVATVIYMAKYRNALDETTKGNVLRCCTAEERLVLKTGSQVMLLKNKDPSKGLVNGAVGVIESFTGLSNAQLNANREVIVELNAGMNNTILPIVSFKNVKQFKVSPETWHLKTGALHGYDDSMYDKSAIPSITQIPLTLAWAISIHKSQSMTLKAIEMDLSKVFEYGQAYVALSRGTGFKGVRIFNLSPDAIRSDPVVLSYYEDISRHEESVKRSKLF
eukprot:Nk52_evm17s224 gene=Nk52_evmTU17s224